MPELQLVDRVFRIAFRLWSWDSLKAQLVTRPYPAPLELDQQRDAAASRATFEASSSALSIRSIV